MDTTESIEAMAEPKPQANPGLRKVMWCASVSYMAQLHGDYGTTVHLTFESGDAGKTLCGKKFPSDKGHPSANRMCKRCLKSARSKGHALVPGETKFYDWVPG